MPKPTDDNLNGGTTNVDGGQDNGGQGGDNGGGNATQTYKIGDKEYTAEQLQDFEKKASDYDSLLPEFTKKSQRLSELEKNNNNIKSNDTKQEDLPPFLKEDWEPKDYNELRQAIKKAGEWGAETALKRLQDMESQKEEAKTQVDNFISGIKSKNKEFNEDDFYTFATKHKFPIKTIDDLEAVYSAYNDLHTSVKATEERLKTEKDKRDKDTIAGNKGGSGATSGVPYAKIRSAGSAFDAVRDALGSK